MKNHRTWKDLCTVVGCFSSWSDPAWLTMSEQDRFQCCLWWAITGWARCLLQGSNYWPLFRVLSQWVGYYFVLSFHFVICFETLHLAFFCVICNDIQWINQCGAPLTQPYYICYYISEVWNPIGNHVEQNYLWSGWGWDYSAFLIPFSFSWLKCYLKKMKLQC